MAILTDEEIAGALRYEDVADVPQLAFDIARSAEAFLKDATGFDWASDKVIDETAKQAARIALVKWFDDPEQANKSAGTYGLTNLIGLLQLKAMDRVKEDG